jgi:hypothetical protein
MRFLTVSFQTGKLDKMPPMNTDIIHAYLRTRESSDEETGKALESLTQQYPWFQGGQVLYALWKKQSGSPDADAHLAKAQLFMNNPLRLNWLVDELEKKSIPEPVLTIHEEEVPRQPIETADTKPSLPVTEEPEASIPVSKKQDEERLTFEPLYSIDYFASQGIRLQQEQLGTDNLSKQVKTFTQWLQSMKKIYHSNQPDVQKTEDRTISHLADASNESDDILTETMAEVLIQQGKKTQAIRIWEKLSLLHPEKSHYFASRISELK